MAKITLHKDDDPLLTAASKRARSTFRYFWREMSWEYRRIIPCMELAAFKVAITDDDETPAEVMWVNEVEFDGYRLKGKLLNEPNWLKSIKCGDPVKVPVKGIADWLYAYDDTAYGGFTVQVIRKQMSKSERRSHDAAWGLDFGAPDKVHMVPPDYGGASETEKQSWFSKLRGKASSSEPLAEDFLQRTEHPMAANMAESLAEFAKKQPQAINEVGPDGLNMFHQLALAGTTIGVKTLLSCGADINGKSKRGHTALAFAKSLGWKKVALFLQQNGGQ